VLQQNKARKTKGKEPKKKTVKDGTAAGKAKSKEDPPPKATDAKGEELYTPELLLGARGRGENVMYFVKWEGFDASENCWAKIKDPKEFLIEKGHEIVDKRIKVKYNSKFGWQKGKIEQFKNKLYSIHYDDGEKEKLDLCSVQKPWMLI